MKLVIGVLFSLFVLLQIRLWIGDGSLSQVHDLQKEVAMQKDKAQKLQERNQRLLAEVQDLKHRRHALEERARTDLGMIRQGETFYQFSLKDEK